MNSLHQQRLYILGICIVGIALAVGLILYALRQNINVFLTPSQIVETRPQVNYHFRLGGMVKKNSLVRDKNNLKMQFVVTDFKKEIVIYFKGILPDLFREGKGVIVDGSLNAQGNFIATQILAKHDENYMPYQVGKLNA